MRSLLDGLIMQGLGDSYDEVVYPGHPIRQSHPDRLATMATLFGMDPAPVDRCRVLEIGCGDGANLIPMALALAGSRFLGIDLAAAPIRRGRRMAEELGLANLALECRDVRDFAPAPEQFDYVIVHGLYAWVAPEVADRILAVVACSLAPQGVAFVSYNALPGAHVRIMMREMLLFHLRRFSDTAEQVAEMQAFLKLLAHPRTGTEGPYHRVQLMQADATRLLDRAPQVVYHDELALFYAPVYFHQFAAHAARHGLQYLAEADFSDMQARGVPAAILEKLALIPDRILREQYLDFLKCRAYRQTLLCREGVALAAEPRPEALAGCHFDSDASPVAAEPNLAPGVAEEFRKPAGWSATTAHPVMKTLLTVLSRAWPRTFSLPDLRERTRLEDPGALTQALLSAYATDLIDIHVHPPKLAAHAGERPTVRPLNRLQLEQGNLVTTLRHTGIDVEGELERRLVMLLDGTRDRAALCAELHVAREELERALEALARLGLLVA